MSQVLSYSILLPRSIDASLIAVYSSGLGVATKNKLKKRKTSLSTIVMHVDVVVAVAFIWR